MGRGSLEAMTETVPDAATALPRLSDRWPTTFGLVQASAALFAIWLIPPFLGIDPRISMAGLVIAGLGRFAHGLWGACNVAKDKVVNRPWSEMCVVAALR